MSSNAKAYILLSLAIISLAYNTIATDFVDAGFQAIAKYVVLVGGICTAIALAYAEAIKSGGGGTTTVPPTASIRKVPPPPPPPNAAQRLLMRWVLGCCVVVLITACKNSPGILTADDVAIDLTDAACEPLENQSAGQPWVDFVCTLLEGTEDIVADVDTPDSGTAVASSTTIAKVKKVRVRIPATEANGFMAAHRKTTTTKVSR
jgi:hypothetical protein